MLLSQARHRFLRYCAAERNYSPETIKAYRQATHTFLDADAAYRFLDEVQDFDWKLLELPAVSPFSFAIYASVIKENMMLEDPTAAIERIYREMYAKVESVTASSRS